MIKMKKSLAWIAAVVAVMFLVTGCSFTTHLSDNTGNTVMESAEQVKEMMTALAAGNMDAALAMMHPERKADAEAGLKQIVAYLDGRKSVSFDQQSFNVSSKSGTNGESRQEKGAFRVELEDGTVMFLSVVHYTDGTGEGFVSFQLVLGVV